MVEDGRMQLVLVLSKSDDIPNFISHVVEIKNMIVGTKTTLSQYRDHAEIVPKHILSEEKRQAIINLKHMERDYKSDEVVNMNAVSIRYGERTILNELSWKIMNGERWALSGQNGAGKSHKKYK